MLIFVLWTLLNRSYVFNTVVSLYVVLLTAVTAFEKLILMGVLVAVLTRKTRVQIGPRVRIFRLKPVKTQVFRTLRREQIIVVLFRVCHLFHRGVILLELELFCLHYLR